MIRPKRGGRIWEMNGRTHGGWAVVLIQIDGPRGSSNWRIVSLPTLRKNWEAEDEEGYFTQQVYAPDPPADWKPGQHIPEPNVWRTP